jgi:hypothetical protein
MMEIYNLNNCSISTAIFHLRGNMNNGRYSKCIYGLGTSLFSLSLVVSETLAATGDTMRISRESNGPELKTPSVEGEIVRAGRYHTCE